MGARLLVDHVICRLEVPKELLSDSDANLLSGLMEGVCVLTGMRKVNTRSRLFARCWPNMVVQVRRQATDRDSSGDTTKSLCG